MYFTVSGVKVIGALLNCASCTVREGQVEFEVWFASSCKICILSRQDALQG
jgi:hypothetical protein